MQKSYFGRLPQGIHAGYRMPPQKIIVRPENHWKSVTFFNINQQQVYRTKISDVDELKRRVNSEWAAVSLTD